MDRLYVCIGGGPTGGLRLVVYVGLARASVWPRVLECVRVSERATNGSNVYLILSIYLSICIYIYIYIYINL